MLNEKQSKELVRINYLAGIGFALFAIAFLLIYIAFQLKF
jgi:hypothetical protein